MSIGAFHHEAGTAIECLSVSFFCVFLSKTFIANQIFTHNFQIPITLNKEPGLDANGEEVLKCGFKIGGGIDQDYQKSPQGYSDNGIYVTEIHQDSAAIKAALRVHDKILQCNGYDFTMVTHKKAVSYIMKNSVLNMLIARKGVTQQS